MLIGYARTSTRDQVAGFEAQKRELEALGAERMFSEQISARSGERPQLETLLGFLQKGDVLLVTKLDRIARSVRDLLVIVDRIEASGASLRIANMGLDTSTATGRLMLNVIGSIAEFERDMMLERQRDGIAKAKQDGKYRGRKPTARAKATDVRRLAAEKVPKIEIARRLKVSRASVYRILDDAAPGSTLEPTA